MGDPNWSLGLPAYPSMGRKLVKDDGVGSELVLKVDGEQAGG